MPQIKAFIVSIEIKYNLALVSTSEFKGLNCYECLVHTLLRSRSEWPFDQA